MNPEHVKIVMQGTESLNTWREVVLNQHIQLDLSDCDLIIGIKEVPVGSLISNKTYIGNGTVVMENALIKSRSKELFKKIKSILFMELN